MSDNGDAGWAAAVRLAMENLHFLGRCDFYSDWLRRKRYMVHRRVFPYASYVLVGLDFLLLVIGILPYTGE